MRNVFDLINTAIIQCADWFIVILDKTGMTSPYLAMFFVALVGRFILSPIFGFATVSAASDAVKGAKERSRFKGHFEKNQRGKYSK